MTRNERRNLIRVFVVGVLLTALVVALDWAGYLTTSELLLGDRRARYCQFFPPQASGKVVNVLMDDQSIDAIGRPPWSRSVLAEVVDELNADGAAVIGLDLLLNDPQTPEIKTRVEGGRRFVTREIDHDIALAE